MVRVAGVEPLSRGTAGPRQDPADGHRLHRRRAPQVWWCADLWVERQRENAHAGPHRADCRPPPDDGGGWPLLRDHAGQLCTGGPTNQRWIRSHGAHLDGRPGAHRCQPAAQLRQLHRAARGLRRVLPAGQRTTTRRDALPTQRAIAQERERLHPLPAQPYTAAFGVARSVGKNLPLVQFEGGEYSVPDEYVGQVVWIRPHDDEIVIVHVGRDGAQEIARWEPTVAGQPRHDPAHFGPQPEGPLHRTPRARTPDEAAFLAIGPGAQRWLITAAAAGTARMRTKMIAAVALAKIYGLDPVDRALATAADLGRFADEDLAQLIRHQATATAGMVRRVDETRSLQTGTAAWAGFGS